MEWNGHTTPNLLSRQAYDASFVVQSNKLVRLSENFFVTANADEVRFGRRVRFVPWSTVRTDLATMTR